MVLRSLGCPPEAMIVVFPITYKYILMQATQIGLSVPWLLWEATR